MSADSFKDNYGLPSQTWLENLTSEFNPNLKQEKQDGRRKLNSQIDPAIQNIIRETSNVVGAYAEGLAIVKADKEQNDEPYEEPSVAADLIEKQNNKQTSFLSKAISADLNPKLKNQNTSRVCTVDSANSQN